VPGEVDQQSIFGGVGGFLDCLKKTDPGRIDECLRASRKERPLPVGVGEDGAECFHSCCDTGQVGEFGTPEGTGADEDRL
jgi:hypothetical protein